MIEKRIKSYLPIFAFGICFMLVSFILPMFRLYNFILGAGISLCICFIVSKVAPSKIIMVEAPAKEANTGDMILDKIINDSRQSLAQIAALSSKISDAHVLEDVNELKSYGDKILGYLEENPRKAPTVRQFMDYYLPTTLKLTENYVSMKSQNAEGENIDKATSKIEEALDTAVTAFKKQFDNMFEASAMDIIAEVNVMEKLLKAQGLLEDGFLEKGGDK